MNKILLSALLCLCNCLVGTAYALPPAGPVTQLVWGGLQQDSSGVGTQDVTLQWNDDSNATGYSLLYYSYNLGFPNDVGQWNTVDLGKVTSISVTLPVGAAYWASIQAYNADGRSPISNIHPIVITPIVIPSPRIVALISRETEREGLLAGFKQFGKQFENVSLDIVKWDTIDAVAAMVNGYLNDPNLTALITTNTSSTLLATQSSQKGQQPLVVAVTATATMLKKRDNVLLMPASNDKQVQTIHEFLKKSVKTDNRMERYAVVMEESASIAVYSFDLYLSLLKQAYDIESPIALTGSTELFSQLVGTFNFNGDSDQAKMIAESLTALKPNIVLYLGSAANFSLLYAQAPGQQWLGSDSVYDLIPQGFKSDTVKILTLGSPDEKVGQGVYYSAYDTIGVLGQVLSSIKGEPTRQSVLEAARQMTPYKGVSGTKTFTETDQTGWYDILTSTPSGWQVVK